MSTDRPLRSDAERNRQRILEAAASAFAECGLTVSLDEVARRAGVGVGTVYRRFPDKEHLIDALFEDLIAGVAELARVGLEADDAWDGLVGFLRGTLQRHAANRGLRELAFSASHGRERVARARERIGPLAEQLVQRARDAGALRPDVEATDVPMLQVMVVGLMDYAGEVRPDAWERYFEILLDGLRARRGSPSPLPGTPLDDDELDRVMAR